MLYKCLANYDYVDGCTVAHYRGSMLVFREYAVQSLAGTPIYSIWISLFSSVPSRKCQGLAIRHNSFLADHSKFTTHDHPVIFFDTK